MWTRNIFFLASILLPYITVLGNDLLHQDENDQLLQSIIDIIKVGKKDKDWQNILCVGPVSDALFQRLQELSSTFAVVADGEDVGMEHAAPHAPHTAILNVSHFQHFEQLFMKTLASPYWHPLTNVILFYNSPLNNDLIAKIFFILWYYKACYVIIVQFDDTNNQLRVTHYNPYKSGGDLPNFGCWTAKGIGIPISNFNNGFVCVEKCHNITQDSKLRANNLGFCIAFRTYLIPREYDELMHNSNFFENFGKNMHGFSMRAYVLDVQPFMRVDVHDNTKFTLGGRDGMIWNTISKKMNFSIDLSPVASTVKSEFDFERIILQIFGYVQRKADLYLIPIYQYDMIIVQIDYTFPVKESGLCIMSQRAGYETNLFDVKLLKENYELLTEFVFCVICIWIVFFTFNATERNGISFDQAGKDLVNVFRSILSISLYKPPKRRSFRIFLATSIWSFFVLNFFTQAAIISFFSTFRRGKDVNTFEDVIEKGYSIEGLASPDAMLPETEDLFKKVNAKLVSIQNLFECAERMINDSHRFCLIDCSVGRFLESNKLNDKGEQYLHIAKRDKFHSFYLNMIFPKYSPLTKEFNRLVTILFEAGLIKKWEEYRFAGIKEEAQIKSLGMDDLMGIFKCYGLLICLCIFVFLIELALGFQKCLKQYYSTKIDKWKRTRRAKKEIKLERKMGKIKQVNSYTQT